MALVTTAQIRPGHVLESPTMNTGAHRIRRRCHGSAACRFAPTATGAKPQSTIATIIRQPTCWRSCLGAPLRWPTPSRRCHSPLDGDAHREAARLAQTRTERHVASRTAGHRDQGVTWEAGTRTTLRTSTLTPDHASDAGFDARRLHHMTSPGHAPGKYRARTLAPSLVSWLAEGGAEGLEVLQ